jgi:hypothetical protein
MKVRLSFGSLLLLCCVIAGCSQQYDANVTGNVTYAGKPLTTGALTFHPTASGPLAMGDIHADGTYMLQTGEVAGLKAGDYLVTVVATGPMPEPTAAEPMPLPKLLIPARYGDVKTSGLKYTVKSGANTINIELSE